MRKITPKVTVIVIFLVLLVVGYYAYLSNRTRERKEEAVMTAVQSTLSRNLEKDYPATPKEVVRFYNEILECLYNEECSEAEVEALGNKARELYDAELLEINEQGAYLINLHAEVKDYREHGRRITMISLASSTNVEKFEEDGFSFARLLCSYNIKENDVNYPTPIVYLLRQNESRQWKIYGWKAASEIEEVQK